MTHKEKAKELVGRFRMYDVIITDPMGCELEGYQEKYYKKCALISVDEKIDTLLEIIGNQKHMYSSHEKSTLDELEEVKQEIEKL